VRRERKRYGRGAKEEWRNGRWRNGRGNKGEGRRETRNKGDEEGMEAGHRMMGKGGAKKILPSQYSWT